MKRQSRTFGFMALSLAAMCPPAIAAEATPPVLAVATKVLVAEQACRGSVNRTRDTLEIEDQAQVKALVSEFEALRAHPTGIQAAKFSCSTDVTFVQGAKTIASIHVFPCGALEHAPVSGKRYFTYKEGLNRLPELNRIAGNKSKAKECK